MPYGIKVFERAILEDLSDLLENVPPPRWDAVGAAIEAKLYAFAQLPTTQRPSSLTVPLYFTADGVDYRWLFSWRYDQSEQTIDITAFGRDGTTIL
jgi:hypothetical protein